MPDRPAVFAIGAFAAAAVLAFWGAYATAIGIESRAERLVSRLLAQQGLSWVEARADGLRLELAGTSPTEATRFRAIAVAGRVVNSGRIIDRMTVTPVQALRAPRFSVELLRNDDGVSMIGLVPTSWDIAPQRAAASALVRDGEAVDMLETADFAIPEGWGEAIEFGMRALVLLPRSKISITPGEVSVTAIADSQAQKRAWEGELDRLRTAGLAGVTEISAPRPVITPFTLRFVRDADGPRFDACAADSERTRARLHETAVSQGYAGENPCVLGLGAPSPRWVDAAVAVISALGELGLGTVTISDVDVTLIVDESVPQANFDRVVGELTARLPEVFSLRAVRTVPQGAGSTAAAAEFTATRSPEGQVQLRGRLADARMRDAVDAFAKARFGSDQVFTATRLEDAVPDGWSTRVLAGLEVLAQVANGSVTVTADTIVLRGTTGDRNARLEISRLLSRALGQGAEFTVDVRYEPRLDPALNLPTPETCVRQANEVLAANKITFAPGADVLPPQAAGAMDRLAEVLRQCEGFAIEIGGHTDSQGRAELNLTLSQNRAEAVLRGLRDRLVPVETMSAKGYGAAEPIADNASAEGRESNRRIAFRLIDADELVAVDGALAVASAAALASAEGLDPSEVPELPDALSPPPPRPDDLVPEPEETLESDGEPVSEAQGPLDAQAGVEASAEPEAEAPGTDADPQELPVPAPAEAARAQQDGAALVRRALGEDPPDTPPQPESQTTAASDAGPEVVPQPQDPAAEVRAEGEPDVYLWDYLPDDEVLRPRRRAE